MVGRVWRNVRRLVASNKRLTSPDCWYDSKSVKLPKSILKLITDALEILNSLIYLPQAIAHAARVSQRLTDYDWLAILGNFLRTEMDDSACIHSSS